MSISNNEQSIKTPRSSDNTTPAGSVIDSERNLNKGGAAKQVGIEEVKQHKKKMSEDRKDAKKSRRPKLSIGFWWNTLLACQFY